MKKKRSAEIFVIKKGGGKQKFSKAKIVSGIKKSVIKGVMPASTINKIASDIEKAVKKKGKNVRSAMIGGMVLNKLKKSNKMVFLRFASIFEKTPSAFKKRIKGI